MLRDGGLEAGDDVGMLGGDLVILGRVDFKIIEQRFLVGDGLLAITSLGDEVQFPGAEARGIELLAAIVAEDFALDGFTFEEQAGQVDAVHRTIRGHRAAGQPYDRREEVEGRCDVALDGGLDLTGHPEDAGDAHAAFPSAALAIAEQASAAAGLGAHQQPRAIVTREDHEGVLGHALFLERLENLADAPVEFLDDVAIDTAAALTLEAIRGEQRRVREGVGEVEEEGLGLVGSDELRGFFGVAAGQLRLVGLGVDEFVAAEERGIPPSGVLVDAGASLNGIAGRRIHVVRVRQAEVEIEAVLERMMLGAVRPDAEVPFADHASRVALRLECLGNRHLGGRQSAGGDGPQDAELVMRHPGADRVTTGQK